MHQSANGLASFVLALFALAGAGRLTDGYPIHMPFTAPGPIANCNSSSICQLSSIKAQRTQLQSCQSRSITSGRGHLKDHNSGLGELYSSRDQDVRRESPLTRDASVIDVHSCPGCRHLQDIKIALGRLWEGGVQPEGDLFPVASPLLVVSGCCGQRQRRQIPIIWRPQLILFSVWPGAKG